MTKDDLDKLRKYVSITLSHSHPEHLDIYLHDILDFCRLNLLEEDISEEELGRKYVEFYNSEEFRSTDTPYFYFNRKVLKQ